MPVTVHVHIDIESESSLCDFSAEELQEITDIAGNAMIKLLFLLDHIAQEQANRTQQRHAVVFGNNRIAVDTMLFNGYVPLKIRDPQ